MSSHSGTNVIYFEVFAFNQVLAPNMMHKAGLLLKQFLPLHAFAVKQRLNNRYVLLVSVYTGAYYRTAAHYRTTSWMPQSRGYTETRVDCPVICRCPVIRPPPHVSYS